MPRLKLITLAAVVAMTILSGCVTPTPEPTETPEPTATDTSTPKPTATKTKTPTPTRTPTRVPSNTPTATTIPPTRPPNTAPAATDEPTQEGPTAEPTQAVESFAPTVATVWQLGRNPLSVSKTEACAEELVLDFYGLVALTPQGDGMTWRRQDGLTYTLGLSSPNNYYGAGASSIPDMTLAVGVTFTSPTTLLVTYTLTPNANGDCHHTWNYDGTFQWNQ